MTEVEVERTERDGDVVLALRGEVDLANAEELAVGARGEVGNTTYALAMDLREVSYLDSAGVRLLFDLADRLRSRRQELVVVAGAGTLVADVFRMVALDKVAIVAEDLDDGLARVRGRPRADGAGPAL